jgi:hypothetical protein
MLGTTFPMHNFWAVSDPQMKPADMINFLKNTALVERYSCCWPYHNPGRSAWQADSSAAGNESIRLNP